MYRLHDILIYVLIDDREDVSIEVPKSIFRKVNKHLCSVFPEEGCGFLAGSGNQASKYYPIENMLHSPTAYQMRPEELIAALFDIEDQGLDILAIVHSHPKSPPIPSATDLNEATWKSLAYLIVSIEIDVEPYWRCWRLVDNRFVKTSFAICNDHSSEV
ncbi:MAG: M67 family metallopeptidase [Chloroflexota bacterium]